MAAIGKKNFLNLGSRKRQIVWDQIRDEPALKKKATVADIPGVGSALALVLRFSISAHGLAVFLFGDDPGPSTV